MNDNSNNPPEVTSAAVSVPRNKSLSARMNRHPRITALVTGVVLLGIVGISLGIGLYTRYDERSAKFDLEHIGRIDEGAVAFDRNGELLGQIALKDRRVISLDDVPPHFIDALIATEDTRFREHNGIDPRGILRALISNIKSGGISQGGSTLTQQLARHAFDIGGRTLDRKLLETFLAVRIENEFTKDEILTHYLNRVYFGAGYWGAEAAARGYFGKPASQLSIAESAALCSIIKSPNRFSPFRDPEAASAARDRTLNRMKDLGMIDPATHAELSGSELTTVSKTARETRPDYLLAAIRKEANEIIGQFKDLDGLQITTTVDATLQTEAISTLAGMLRSIEQRDDYPHRTRSAVENSSEKSGSYLQGAVVVIENASGNVVSAVGGRDFSDSQFDRVWQAKRKPGTAITPFLYAAAFSDGKVSPLDIVLDAPLDNREVMIGGLEGVLGEWGAERNDNDYEGEITPLYALVAGKNSATVRVGQTIGPERFESYLGELGLNPESTGYPNSFLGENRVRLIDLVHSYSLFPNGGKSTARTNLIKTIVDKEGKVLYPVPGSFELELEQKIAPEAANLIDLSLRQTSKVPPLSRRNLPMEAGTFGAKGGTSYDSNDSWFIGYNDTYTWGVWIGFDEPVSIFKNAFAVETAFPVWSAIARSLPAADAETITMAEQDSTGVCITQGCQPGDNCSAKHAGDFVMSLPNTYLSDKNLKPCPVHNDAAPPVEIEIRESPDLFTNFSPVMPAAPIIEGGNPWATPKNNHPKNNLPAKAQDL
ncbi:MAG: transglycosylase domain-containing protein [Verrucomicrobiales bacterium]|nr:transglycosylase domain-containing protein [Verrucomicrobiales bacterium]